MNNIANPQTKTEGFLYCSFSANYVDEAAGFFPPYVEKKVIYPELFKNKN